MSKNWKLEDIGSGVHVMTLSRAPVNAVNPAYLDELDKAFIEIGENDAVQALILNSDLKVFSAGMDLKEAKGFTSEDQTAVVDGLNTTYARLYALPKPVIAAVNRAAIAGGLFFALAADYAIADKGAKLGLTEVRVGVDFPLGALEIARAEMTPLTFKRVLLSGLNFAAEEAKDMGLVNEVVASADLMPRAIEIAKSYATTPPLAFANVKAQMRKAVNDLCADVIAKKSDPARDGWFTDETLDSLTALLDSATGKS